MQTNHANALRGLSIAVVIIAGLTILACVIGFVFLGVGGSYLANMSPDMWEYYLDDGDYYDYGYGYDYYGVDGSDMAAIMALLVGVGGIAIFWELALSVVGLIAGILGLRNYQNPGKLNLVFGWSLAGAIAALLSGNMVTMVLLIIMCVFAYKDKQLAAAQPIVMAQPVVTAAPVQPGQPVQPVAAPVTDAPAPAVSAQPAQPVETVQVAVEAVEAGTPITESAGSAAEPSALVQEEALEVAEEAKNE